MELGSKIETLPVSARDLLHKELVSLLLLDPGAWRDRESRSIVPLGPGQFRNNVTLEFTIRPELFLEAVRTTERRLRFAEDSGHIRRFREAVDGYHDERWLRGQIILLVVPLFLFNKRILLGPILEDSQNRLLTTLNRVEDSAFAAHHLLSGRLLQASFTAASLLGLPENERARRFPLREIEPLIRAMTYAMPDEIGAHFNPRSKIRDPNAVIEFLEAHEFGPPLTLETVEALMAKGSHLMDQLARTRIMGRADRAIETLLFPLLIAPDYLRLRRLEDSGVSAAAVLQQFATMTDVFLDVIEALMIAHVMSGGDVRVEDGLVALAQFSRQWIMCTRARITLGESNLVRFRDTTKLGSSPERRSKNLWFSFLMRYAQRYVVPLGEAMSNHLEVLTPDPSSAHLFPAKAELWWGEELVWKGERDEPRQSIARTISKGWLVVSRRLTSNVKRTPHPLGRPLNEVVENSLERLAFYMTQSPSEFVRRIPSAAAPEGPGELQRLTIRVVFRPILRMRMLYLALTLFALYAGGAAIIDWGCLGFGQLSCSFGALPEPLSGTTSFFTALLVGFLATRDRDTISGRCVRTGRYLLMGALLLLLLDVGRAIYLRV